MIQWVFVYRVRATSRVSKRLHNYFLNIEEPTSEKKIISVQYKD